MSTTIPLTYPRRGSELNNITSYIKESIQKRKSELRGLQGALGRLKASWGDHKNTRLIIGAGLLTGGIIATASGATGTVGVILAVRTTINALGAYITTEELCKRYLPNTSPADVKRNIIIASTSALVAGILGGNGILNTLEHAPVSSLQEPLSELVPQKVTSEHVQAQVLSAPYDTNPSSLLSESGKGKIVSDIISDIQHDHPNQGYITLEQTIRRIDGLTQGIGLHESKKLQILNESVSKSVHDPQGKIAGIMKSFGFIKETEALDIAFRKLRTEDISKIALEYMGTGDASLGTDVIGGSLSNELIHSVASTNSGVTVIAPGDILSTAATVSSPGQKNYIISSLFGLLGLGTAGYFWNKNRGERKWKNAPTQERTPSEISSQIISKREIPVVLPPEKIEKYGSEVAQEEEYSVGEIFTPIKLQEHDVVDVSDITPGANSHPEENSQITKGVEYILNAEQIRAKTTIDDYLSNEYDWKCIDTSNSPEEIVDSYAGKSAYGIFIILVHYTKDGISFETLWRKEDGIYPLGESRVFSEESINSPIDKTMRFNERFDAYFLENIKTRDALSISLMPSVTKYSLTRKMLEDIYKQSDNPLYKNLETQGAIYADGLGVKDGTIHFFEQSIPKFHELSVSGGTVQYNASSGGKFMLKEPLNIIERTYPRKEASILVNYIIKNLSTPLPVIFIGGRDNLYYRNSTTGEVSDTFMQSVSLPGSIIHRFWHKHPPGYMGPSPGDVLNGEMETANRYRGLNYHFHFIVVPIRESEVEQYRDDPYFHLLSKDVYGGRESYVISGYKFKCNGRGHNSETTRLKLLIED